MRGGSLLILLKELEGRHSYAGIAKTVNSIILQLEIHVNPVLCTGNWCSYLMWGNYAGFEAEISRFGLSYSYVSIATRNAMTYHRRHSPCRARVIIPGAHVGKKP